MIKIFQYMESGHSKIQFITFNDIRNKPDITLMEEIEESKLRSIIL